MSESTPGSSTHAMPSGWDDARLNRLLFRALSTLARRGWIVAPSDVDELLQGFRIKLWLELLPTWDPHQASFATYAYNRFVGYTKAWLLRDRRYKQKQVDIEALRDAYATSPTPGERSSDLQDLMRDSLRLLPHRTQAVLNRYLSVDRPSERDLATEFKTTRHDIRNHLTDGFGRILIGFRRPPDISVEDWEILLCLYQRGLTVAETSRLLRRDAAAIDGVRSRLLSRLASIR